MIVCLPVGHFEPKSNSIFPSVQKRGQSAPLNKYLEELNTHNLDQIIIIIKKKRPKNGKGV